MQIPSNVIRFTKANVETQKGCKHSNVQLSKWRKEFLFCMDLKLVQLKMSQKELEEKQEEDILVPMFPRWMITP